MYKFKRSKKWKGGCKEKEKRKKKKEKRKKKKEEKKEKRKRKKKKKMRSTLVKDGVVYCDWRISTQDCYNEEFFMIVNFFVATVTIMSAIIGLVLYIYRVNTFSFFFFLFSFLFLWSSCKFNNNNKTTYFFLFPFSRLLFERTSLIGLLCHF